MRRRRLTQTTVVPAKTAHSQHSVFRNRVRSAIKRLTSKGTVAFVDTPVNESAAAASDARVHVEQVPAATQSSVRDAAINQCKGGDSACSPVVRVDRVVVKVHGMVKRLRETVDRHQT